MSHSSTGSLAGRRVLVTRAEEGGGRLEALLAARGAEVVRIPLSRFEDPPSWDPLRDAVSRLDSFQRALFTSATSVERFFPRLKELSGRAGLPAAIRVAAVGPRTAAALLREGVADLVHAESFRAEGLLDLLPAPAVSGQEILFPRALEARELLVEELTHRGARVTVVPVYRTVIAREKRNELRAALGSGLIDVVTFTAASAIRHFVELAGAQGVAAIRGGVQVACLGEVTAQAAVSQGIHPDIVPARATLEDLTEAIAQAQVPARRHKPHAT